MTFAAERPGLAPGKARLPEPARKMTQARCGDRARPCRFHRAETRLPRSESAPQADAGQSAGARRVRGGRAGAGRGDRLAADGGRCEKPHRDARRSFPSRQVRRDHRPRRRAAVGCAGDAGARAPDRPGAARRRRARWSISGVRCWKTRSARGSTSSSARHRGPGQVRRRWCMICCRRSISATTATPTADDDENQDENQRRRERSVRRRRLARQRRRAGNERRPGAGLDRRDVGKRDGKRAGLHAATPSTTANSATTRRRAKRRGRIRAAPTSRAGRNITPSRRNSTR